MTRTWLTVSFSNTESEQHFFIALVTVLKQPKLVNLNYRKQLFFEAFPVSYNVGKLFVTSTVIYFPIFNVV